MSAEVPLTVVELTTAGRIRSRTLDAMAAELRMQVGICSDRGRVLVAKLLDVGLDAGIDELERLQARPAVVEAPSVLRCIPHGRRLEPGEACPDCLASDGRPVQ